MWHQRESVDSSPLLGYTAAYSVILSDSILCACDKQLCDLKGVLRKAFLS